MSQNKYTLSIRVSSDGFFLSILDDTGTMLISRNIPAQLFALAAEEIVSLFREESSILDTECNNTRIVVETNQYVLVPESLFNPKETDTYFNFQFTENKNNVVIFNRIEWWSNVNVFSLPAALNEALERLFPDETILHQVSYILSDKIRSDEDGLYVWMRPDMFDIVVLKDKQLLLMNTYSYRTPEDITYYILSIYEQFGLNVEGADVKLYQREKTDEIQSMISQYIRNCKVFLQK